MASLSFLIPLIILLQFILASFNLIRLFVGRALGVYFSQFSFGMGPTLFVRTDKSGTTWVLKAFPIATSVSFAKRPLKLRTFYSELKESWMNYSAVLAMFLFAFLIIFVAKLLVGDEVSRPVIGKVKAGYPAFSIGLQAGDEIVSINDLEVKSFSDLSDKLRKIGEKQSKLAFKRNGQVQEVEFTPKKVKGHFNDYSFDLGILRSESPYAVRYRKLSKGEAAAMASLEVISAPVLAFNQLTRFINGAEYFHVPRHPMTRLEVKGNSISAGSIRLSLDASLAALILATGAFVFYSATLIGNFLWLSLFHKNGLFNIRSNIEAGRYARQVLGSNKDTIEKILIRQSAYNSQDHYEIIQNNIAFLNALRSSGFIDQLALPQNSLRSYYVDYYLAQVSNGGHAQFLGNSGLDPQVMKYIGEGLEAMKANDFLGIFNELCRFLKEEPERAGNAAESYGFGSQDTFLEDLNSRYFKLDAYKNLAPLNAAWLKALPEIVVVSDHVYARTVEILCAGKPGN